MTYLNESGLQKNDLDYLLLPMVNIDTFESKISNKKAVVLAFYVFEKDPARDLERFIERGEINVLDTETSPAPTIDGYYVVFVEMDRDDNLPEKIFELISQINRLTNVDEWQFKTYRDPEIHDLTEENLKKFLNLDPDLVPDTPDEEKEEESDEDLLSDESEDDEELAEKAAPILVSGLMETLVTDGNVLHMTSPGMSLRYQVLSVSDQEPSVPITVFNIGDPMIAESSRLGRILGASYLVETVEDGLLVSSPDGYVILKPLD
jgi:hypothetical protein